MLPPDKRRVHFYSLAITSVCKKYKNPGCAHIADLLKALDFKARVFQKGKTGAFEIADYHYDKVRLSHHLLINYADSNHSDLTLTDIHARSKRKLNKTATEGLEQSAHVIIKIDKAKNREAILMMTMGSGIGYPDVLNTLKTLLNEAKDDAAHASLFNFQDPSGATEKGIPLKYKVRYKLEIFPYKGKYLDDVLKNGSFVGMELINTSVASFGSNGSFSIKSQNVHVIASNANSVTGAAIKNAIYPVRQSFDKVRITYKENGEEKSHSIDINSLDNAFTLKEDINLATSTDALQHLLCKDIIDGMHKISP